MDQPRAWLALSKAPEEYRVQAGRVHYDDDPASHYSWDSSVQNHALINVGDVIAIWDRKTLLGVSVIESILSGTAIKTRGRCPECGRTAIDKRTTMQPTYRCTDCEAEFEVPVITSSEVVTYRSDHSQAWVDLEGLIDAPRLRILCISPKSQHSFRQLKIDSLRQALIECADGNPLQILDAVSEQISGGHTRRSVRVRVGQAAFRAKLQKKYGNSCAFSGPLPAAVLDACHLYSYAKVGEHKDHGGLLLRNDLHRLFDRGLVAVNTHGVLDVASDLEDYPIYAQLHGQPIHVDLTPNQQGWLRQHWGEWRPGGP